MGKAPVTPARDGCNFTMTEDSTDKVTGAGKNNSCTGNEKPTAVLGVLHRATVLLRWKFTC